MVPGAQAGGKPPGCGDVETARRADAQAATTELARSSHCLGLGDQHSILESNGLRLRYGVVPYSSTVNVGSLIRGVNPAYLSDTTWYQSRVGDYDDFGTRELDNDNE